MHYRIHLFTKELPTEDQIQDIMAPYYDDAVYGDSDDESRTTEKDIVYPAIMLDYFTIGGRYCGQLKLKMDNDNEEYEWNYYAKTPREGRLFHSSLLKKIREEFKRSWDKREEEWYGYMGDGSYILVDGARICDILNIDEITCYGFVDINGQAYSCESWNGSEFEEHPHFENLYKQKLNEYKDYFLTVLDIHD